MPIRFSTRPNGVVSKNDIGDRSRLCKSGACKLRLADIPPYINETRPKNRKMTAKKSYLIIDLSQIILFNVRSHDSQMPFYGHDISL